MKEKVVINGMVTDVATASIDDRGFTLGDGLFETIPIYGGATFMLGGHLERMQKGSERIGLELPVDEKKLAYAVAELTAANQVRRGVARLTVTRGPGPRGYSSEGAGPVSWFLTVRPYDPPEAKRREGGFDVIMSPYPVDPSNPLRAIKSISAMDKALAADHAKKHEADEALSLTHSGHICSLQSANIFWVSGGVLFTPSSDCGILDGITRQTTLKLAQAEGIESKEGKYYLSDLHKADEVFATNSLIELMPVKSVEGGSELGENGPVTTALSEAYQKLL